MSWRHCNFLPCIYRRYIFIFYIHTYLYDDDPVYTVSILYLINFNIIHVLIFFWICELEDFKGMWGMCFHVFSKNNHIQQYRQNCKKKLMTNSFAGNGKKRILNKPQNDGVSTPVFFVNGRNDFGWVIRVALATTKEKSWRSIWNAWVVSCMACGMPCMSTLLT